MVICELSGYFAQGCNCNINEFWSWPRMQLQSIINCPRRIYDCCDFVAYGTKGLTLQDKKKSTLLGVFSGGFLILPVVFLSTYNPWTQSPWHQRCLPYVFHPWSLSMETAFGDKGVCERGYAREIYKRNRMVGGKAYRGEGGRQMFSVEGFLETPLF